MKNKLLKVLGSVVGIAAFAAVMRLYWWAAKSAWVGMGLLLPELK